MKSLSDTSVFKYAEMMGANKITSCIKAIVNEKQGAMFPTEEQLEDVFYKIRHKSFNYSGKFAVLDLYRKGIIKLVYNDRVKLTVAVPFFKYKMPTGGFGVIVNITNYAKLNSDGTIKIDPGTLCTLMLSAAFSLVDSNYISLICTGGLVELYTELLVNVLAKLIVMDPVKREVFKFIFTKFMLVQCGYDDARASSGAKNACKLDNATIENIDLSCPATVYNDFETLINHLKNQYNNMNNVTIGIIFDRWMRTYGEASAFALEHMSSIS